MKNLFDNPRDNSFFIECPNVISGSAHRKSLAAYHLNFKYFRFDHMPVWQHYIRQNNLEQDLSHIDHKFSLDANFPETHDRTRIVFLLPG